ncbi:MAG: Eco57I restriction-modification methylase domain-containing protein [Kiritimatiellia bacterium]
MLNLKDEGYNPDVLCCLANLSNDEVFTPPEIANKMLDLLPQELFRDPSTTFLDPACKSGVFLREIARRLIVGLQPKIPDLQERLDHIFHRQLFGIAITQLTSLLSRRSLYCSKFPNSKYSVSHFDSPEGNIRFRKTQHAWKDGKCRFCGASQREYDRDAALETHAYEFIHVSDPKEIFKMKFDVIIGNPPYQLGDGSDGAGAMPIYQKFVRQALALKPSYLTMVIPARWYSGGRGGDLGRFRSEMIKDQRISELHDFADSTDCFSGVQIKGGVCYFLWDATHSGTCTIVTHNHNNVLKQCPRLMTTEGCDVFIRYEEGVSILNKVRSNQNGTFDVLVSAQRPFGLRTYVLGKDKSFPNSIQLYQNGGIGYIRRQEVLQNIEWIPKYKIFVSAAYGAGDDFPHQIIGKPLLGNPGSCCTETYLVVGPFKTKHESECALSYMKTRFFRFMVMLQKTTQHAAASVYSLVPLQDFSKPWTDEELYKKYGLSAEEIAFIESMIRPMA